MRVKFTVETPLHRVLIPVFLLLACSLSTTWLRAEGAIPSLPLEEAEAPLTTNFITEWTYPNGSTSIIFSGQTAGSVNYTWSAAPSGNSGSGSFSQTGFPALITLSGLNIAAGDVVTLTMEPTNLRGFNMSSNSSHRANLSKVTQWGSVPWTFLSYGFYECVNLTITATDAPNLSGLTSLAFMFYGCAAMNQDISHWDVSTVTSFESMFQNTSTFNQNISTWNMSNATQLRWMFAGASVFNQPIGVWNTQNVTDMSNMFRGASAFNQDISTWNTAKVTRFDAMFREATAFNQPIGSWNTAAAVNMSEMFNKAAAFSQPIGTWNTGNVTVMNAMLAEANSFNQPIGTWNTASVTNMNGLFFNNTAFNQPIGTWNTGNVTDMSNTFYGATAFNQNINSWNTSKVTTFFNTFYQATAFNQPLDNWNTSAATNMRSMFDRASAFNQPIGNWNVSKVTNMRTMFLFATNFNQDLSAWDVSKVTDMTGMFVIAPAFNQSLGSWTLNPTVMLGELLNNCGMNCSNYSRTLYEWAQNPNIPLGRTLGATNRQYGPDAIAARATLISKGWTITGDSPGTGACGFPRPFVTEWVFSAADSVIQFNALTTGGSVTYTWSARPSGTSGSGSFTQATAGAVSLGGLTISAGDTVTLNLSTDMLSRFYMLNATAAAKLRDVKQWSDVAWTSMASAFENCSNLRISATDSPILTGVTSMADMFKGATVFNTDISTWNTETVTDMSGTFSGAAAFNQDIGEWNTAAVTSMADMFSGASAFDQDINGWNTANVSDFSDMFNAASAFNQPFSGWSFNQATDLSGFISNTGLDCENYTSLLLKLANNPNTPQGLTLGANNLGYGTGGVNARNKLINDFGWTIIGDEPGTEPCVNCPDLSLAPAEVLVTNSTCTSNCTPSGGSFAAPTSPCPEGAFLQYQVNGGDWTDTLPAYAQTGPAQTIKTRCICENDGSFVSPASDGVLTAPGTCTLPDASITGTSTVCAGGSTTLTAAGASTFSWSTSATSEAITVNPASTTTYRVTVTAANGCTDTASVQVTVLPLPLISCPSDMMVNTSTGGAGDCSGVASWTHPIETAGACTPLVLRMSINSGSPTIVTAGAVVNQAFNAGLHTIDYTITDGGNNTAQCSFTISVSDNENPQITCTPNAEVKFNGELSIALDAQVLASATDNCGIVSQLVSPTSISVDQLGQSVPVSILVQDQAGNAAACQVSVQVKGLPRGWRHNNGSVGDCASDVNYNGSTGVWTATATSCRNVSPYQSDKLMFAQYTLCGNGSITAQVSGLDGALPFGGVIMRETTGVGAKKVQMMVNRQSNILRREIRMVTGGEAFPMDFSSPAERSWLRLERTGNQFRGYTSRDGLVWWYVMNVVIPMNECIEMGLILANMQQGVPGMGTFSHVSVTGSGQGIGLTEIGQVPDQDMQQVLDVRVFPNPSDGQLRVDVSAFQGKDIQLTVYDLLGKVMFQRQYLQQNGVDDMLRLELDRIPAGIYLLGVKTEGLPELSKRLVIQR